MRVAFSRRLAGTASLTAALTALSSAAQEPPQPKPQTVAAGLSHPWSVAFLPDGRFLVTERPGRLRVIDKEGRIAPPVAGLPPLVAEGQGGLLDVALDASFATNRTLFFCFSEPGPSGTNSTALARAVLTPDATRLEQVRVIFTLRPKVASRAHFGCRIAQSADGKLFLTLGDRFSRSADAQKLDNHLGKVVRIDPDGQVPADNPFAGRTGALPEIWSYGHRNMQGATIGPDGRLWTHEHGAQGGDEINIAQAGRNYGWPVITHGVNYGGAPIGEGIKAKEGMEQPLHQWTPSIAPSGMAFLTSDRYGPAWKGSLLVGSLKFGYLDRIDVRDGKVVGEQKLLAGGRERIRDVRQGPDGLIYVLTDEDDGKLIRLQP